MGNMRFKVGDRVQIKSIDWYNENKSKSHGTVACGGKYFDYDMKEWCGKTMTIFEVHQTCYLMEEDGFKHLWTDEMIEGLVEEETKPNVIGEAKTYWDSIKDAWVCPDGYIFKDENGNVINAMKIVLEKKKKEYPKTYEECCQYLGCDDKIPLKIIGEFTKLINARNAYWKIAGEEMGLGKPWEPDWEAYDKKYVIGMHEGMIYQDTETRNNKILAFPTEEMRDAFYENFKEEIEICKELL